MLTYSKASKRQAEKIEQQVLDIRAQTIECCERCGGTGRILLPHFDEESMQFLTFLCRCKRRYGYIVKMMMAGVPASMAQDILDNPLYNRKVVELDIKNRQSGTDINTSKPRDFVTRYVDPYIENDKRVMEKGFSYLFIGVNSVGKTYSSIYILHNYLKRGYNCYYIKFRELMRVINRALNSKTAIENEYFLDDIKDKDLLVIDELGKETGSRDHISGEIEELLKNRDMARKPTIVISNEEFADIEALYSSHIIGAFMRNYKALIFNPVDFRAKDRAEEWF